MRLLAISSLFTLSLIPQTFARSGPNFQKYGSQVIQKLGGRALKSQCTMFLTWVQGAEESMIPLFPPLLPPHPSYPITVVNGTFLTTKLVVGQTQLFDTYKRSDRGDWPLQVAIRKDESFNAWSIAKNTTTYNGTVYGAPGSSGNITIPNFKIPEWTTAHAMNFWPIHPKSLTETIALLLDASTWESIQTTLPSVLDLDTQRDFTLFLPPNEAILAALSLTTSALSDFINAHLVQNERILLTNVTKSFETVGGGALRATNKWASVGSVIATVLSQDVLFCLARPLLSTAYRPLVGRERDDRCCEKGRAVKWATIDEIDDRLDGFMLYLELREKGEKETSLPSCKEPLPCPPPSRCLRPPRSWKGLADEPLRGKVGRMFKRSSRLAATGQRQRGGEPSSRLVRNAHPLASDLPRMDEEDPDNLVLGSTFPLPPPHHAKFTSHNLRLLGLLTSAHASSSTSSFPSPSSFSDPKGKQREILKDEEDVPDWDLEVELKEPRVDWIEENGEYEVFGATYFIPQRIPDVEGMGVKRLIPADTSDPKPHLLTLLHSLLHTNLLLLSALTHPPPVPSEEGDQNYQTVAGPYVARMADIGVNMMAGVNALRGVQARVTLEQMMTSQLERRREETREIKRKCSELAQTLATLRQSLPTASTSSMEVDAAPAVVVPPPTTSNGHEPPIDAATSEESRARAEREKDLWASLDAI